MIEQDVADAELATRLVQQAGRLAQQMLAEGLQTQRKTSVSDVVSAADHAAEKLIANELSRLRPHDGVIGEEGADRSGARTWHIDPVDGTYNFLSGLPAWCAALALSDDAGPVLGAIYQPVADELWLGGRDLPATPNGAPLTPLRDRPLAEVSVASYLHPSTMPDTDTREPWLRATEGAATIRMLGSGSIELAAVAAGRLGASLQHDSLDWDWLPGMALVLAAGGAADVVHVAGHRWHVAGNRQTVDELCWRLLKD